MEQESGKLVSLAVHKLLLGWTFSQLPFVAMAPRAYMYLKNIRLSQQVFIDVPGQESFFLTISVMASVTISIHI